MASGPTPIPLPALAPVPVPVAVPPPVPAPAVVPAPPAVVPAAPPAAVVAPAVLSGPSPVVAAAGGPSAGGSPPARKYLRVVEATSRAWEGAVILYGLRDPVQFHDAGVEILVPVSPVSAAAYDKLLENVARALAAKGIPVEQQTEATCVARVVVYLLDRCFVRGYTEAAGLDGVVLQGDDVFRQEDLVQNVTGARPEDMVGPVLSGTWLDAVSLKWDVPGQPTVVSEPVQVV
jgi:hypothetical protein